MFYKLCYGLCFFLHVPAFFPTPLYVIKSLIIDVRSSISFFNPCFLDILLLIDIRNGYVQVGGSAWTGKQRKKKEMKVQAGVGAKLLEKANMKKCS